MVLATVSLVAQPMSAEATGGNCSSWSESNNRPWYDRYYRVVARCSSLNADNKADGVLDRVAGRDNHTGWFTQLNTDRRSDWGLPAIRGTYVTIAHV